MLNYQNLVTPHSCHPGHEQLPSLDRNQLPQSRFHHQQPPNTKRFPGPTKSIKRLSSFYSSREKNKKIKVNAVKPVIFGGQSLIKEGRRELFVFHTWSALSPIPEFFLLISARIKLQFYYLQQIFFPFLTKLKITLFYLVTKLSPLLWVVKKECVPSVRMKDPFFDTLKETLLAQKKRMVLGKLREWLF